MRVAADTIAVNAILIFLNFIIVPLIMIMQIMPRFHSWPLPPKSEHKLLSQRRNKLGGIWASDPQICTMVSFVTRI